MTVGIFVKNTTITFTTSVLNFVLGMGTSIIIARILGPEGKGIYSLTVLLPSLIVTFINFGVGPATIYYAAKKYFSYSDIFGNNILLSIFIGIAGVIIGLIVTLFFHQNIFPNIPQKYLLFSLLLIPLTLFFSYNRSILLGIQRIKEFNKISLIHSILFLLFIIIFLCGLKIGVMGALTATMLSWFLANLFLFFWVKKVTGEISFRINYSYIKKGMFYGIQAHFGNILGFLNYRIDMLLVNWFLGPISVGFYSIGVGLVEKLLLVSHAASTVLFPRVAAENERKKCVEFTPLVARTVFWLTTIGAFIIYFLSRWIVVLLYSKTFLPSILPLQILLPGIIALSVAKVLANDNAGRGRVIQNNYVGLITVVTNIILNILWIPRYGISGAALASTISYIFALIAQIFIYCRLSDVSWTKIIFLQKGDGTLYFQIGRAFAFWLKGKARGIL